MVAEIWASVISSFVDQLVALMQENMSYTSYLFTYLLAYFSHIRFEFLFIIVG